jgi:hypothetical protein
MTPDGRVGSSKLPVRWAAIWQESIPKSPYDGSNDRSGPCVTSIAGPHGAAQLYWR